MAGSRSGKPPAPDKRPERLQSAHGQRVDDYAWMRDDSRRSVEVLRHLRREDRYTEDWFAPLRSKLKALHAEMRARIPDHDESVPVRRGDYLYYWRDLPGRDHSRYYRRGLQAAAPEQLILDAQRRAAGSEAYSVGELLPSPDGRYLALSEDRDGNGVYELRIKDLRNSRWLPDRISQADAGMVWAADSKTLLYVHKDPGTLAALEVRSHALRQSPELDRSVYRESDPAYYLSLSSSHSERYLVIHAETTRRSKVLRLPANAPESEPQPISPGSGQARLYYDDDGKHAWLLSDQDAPNFQLWRAPLRDGVIDDWQTMVGHDAEVVLEDFLPLEDGLIVVERRNAQLGLRLIDYAGAATRSLFETDGISALSLDDNPVPDPQRIRVRRDYLQRPGELLELDIGSGALSLLKTDAIAGDFDPAQYCAERIDVASSGGALVPVSILRRCDRAIDGTAALWLGAYGAYGESLDPAFDADRLSLLDRGMTIAFAHVRGGGERGADWHDQGRGRHKSHSVDDLLAVSQALIERGYVRADGLIAVGGSAGGLLVAAAINRQPQRFAAALLQVPFVDVLSSMLDESLPLTQLEYAEWGDPRQPADYQSILSWSPYDNLKSAAYPPILATTGLHDGQVAYWEPAKYIARVRDLSTSNKVALLKVDLGAGHQGVSGRYSSLGEVVMSYGFALELLGEWELEPAPRAKQGPGPR